jgi:hypothetical protein
MALKRILALNLLLASVCGVAAAADAVKPCADGTVASYLGTSCSEGTVVSKWLTYSCTSTPASICAALGTNGSKVHIGMDRQGPYTFQVGKTAAWNVQAGQKVEVTIGGTVYGARGNGNWPHFEGIGLTKIKGIRGQTGDGTEEMITTVNCGANCLDANKGVSDILCSATSPAANCTEVKTMVPYLKNQAVFNEAPSDNPYPFTIEIKLDGGTNGTARLFTVGAHFWPRGKFLEPK